MSPDRISPFWALTRARLLLFLREPGAVFWNFAFPVIAAVVLGLAFSRDHVERLKIAVAGEQAAELVKLLSENQELEVISTGEHDARELLKNGKIVLAIVATKTRVHHYDPMRVEGRLARALAEDTIERASGRRDVGVSANAPITEPGSRYIDFLVPGLMALSVSHNGILGVGYFIVDMRTRKQLKRLASTPMKRWQLLASLVIVRTAIALFGVLVMLISAKLIFSVNIQGSLLLLAAVTVLGVLSFSGLGLLLAARTDNAETMGGLMNLILIPMMIGSGVFFSIDRFPALLQRVAEHSPLAVLSGGLRSVMNDGAGLVALFPVLLVLALWSAASFVAALRMFRWQ